MNPYDLPKVRVKGAPGYDTLEGRLFMNFEQAGRTMSIVMHLWQGRYDTAIIDSKYVFHVEEEG